MLLISESHRTHKIKEIKGGSMRWSIKCAQNLVK